MAKGLIFLIKVYQFMISPYLGPCCRFFPSCSDYAMEAFKKHGLFRGMCLSCCRLMRCHPGSEGGMDLVP
jgi:putative membrane protein insertion efficiency factor